MELHVSHGHCVGSRVVKGLYLEAYTLSRPSIFGNMLNLHVYMWGPDLVTSLPAESGSLSGFW